MFIVCVYIYIYLEKKEKVFILNSNTYDLIYNFFKLYPKTFFVNWYEHYCLKKKSWVKRYLAVFLMVLLFFFFTRSNIIKKRKRNI